MYYGQTTVGRQYRVCINANATLHNGPSTCTGNKTIANYYRTISQLFGQWVSKDYR